MNTRRKFAATVIIIVALLCFAFYLWNQGPLNGTTAADIPNSSYTVIEVKEDPRELAGAEGYITLYNQTDFEEAIRLLQGSNAVVFHESPYYYFPYQGYLIVYRGTLE